MFTGCIQTMRWLVMSQTSSPSLASYDLLKRSKSSFLVIGPDIVIRESSTHWSTGPLREDLIYLGRAAMSRISYSRKKSKRPSDKYFKSSREVISVTYLKTTRKKRFVLRYMKFSFVKYTLKG